MFAAVALEPSVEFAARFAAFRACYDPNYCAQDAGGQAHITIKRPAGLLRPVPEVVERFQEISGGLNLPVRVAVGGISVYHSSGASAIFLRVVPDRSLHAIHQLFRAGLSGYLESEVAFEGEFYMPHLTLANGLSDRQLASALGLLQLHRPDLSGCDFTHIECPVLSLAITENPFQVNWQRIVTISLD